MAPFSLFLSFYLYIFLPLSVSAGQIATEFLHPNFSGSYYHYIDHSGVFLVSPNSTFALAFYKPDAQASLFYLSILHYPSHTPVWTAKPSSALPSSFLFSFTVAGLSLTIPSSNSTAIWSTPSLMTPAASLWLLDSGELQLLDSTNVSLWSSFSQPTDTILPGQTLPTDASLLSATSNIDLTPGPYRLLITSSDALLQWSTSNNSFLSYWALSLDLRATKNSNKPAAYLSVNTTGLYLISSNATNSIVSGFLFPPPTSNKEIRFLRLDASGQLHIMSYYLPSNSKTQASDLSTPLLAPASQCDLPFTCKTLGLCSAGSNGLRCSCPSKFGASTAGGCMPADGSFTPSCSSGIDQESSVSYLSLGIGIDYFANRFVSPDPSINDISSCEKICSSNCSCLGFFYKNSSKECYLLEHKLGTLLTSKTEDHSSAVGYVKTMRQPPSQTQTNNSSKFSTIFLVVFLPFVVGIVGIVLFYTTLVKWRKGIPIGGRTRSNREAEAMRSEADQDPSTPVKTNLGKDEISIPGLPTRFTYSDLEIATVNFSQHIGSGGFGSVYKGNLPDKTTVAVKRMANMGRQARHEFLTEIAIISNVRHINLVKLRGFCAEGNHCMLVYEYMNRGSLDQPLFRLDPPLDWSERFQIAIGAARGLAYLHSGCDHKIIHCDVKPENILLDDQKGVKIADFGLAKLIAPEQSGLFTTLRGTRGYLAPEWLTNSSITDKTDVYSFGMVLLEIVHGRKNWSEGSWCKPASSTKTNGYFPMVALKKHKERRYDELIDPRIEKRMDTEEIGRVIKVALCCLHEESCFRPSMKAVAAMLEGSIEVPEPRVKSLHHLSMYERGFMGMDMWGTNPVNGGTNAESASPACFESNSTKSACNLPSYLSAEQLSGPR